MDNPLRPIVFRAAARTQLDAIERYITGKADPDTAAKFVQKIIDRCEVLASVPFLGSPRDDWRPGLQTLAYKKRVTIGYKVEKDRVVIVAVLYGGRDLKRHLAR